MTLLSVRALIASIRQLLLNGIGTYEAHDPVVCIERGGTNGGSVPLPKKSRIQALTAGVAEPSMKISIRAVFQSKAVTQIREMQPGPQTSVMTTRFGSARW